jgi:hypothetical protein
MDSLLRSSRYAAVVGGMLLPAYLLLHPPRDAASVAASPYASLHVLGILTMLLVLCGLPALCQPLLRHTGRFAPFSIGMAFVATALWLGYLFLDAYMNPILATYAPDLVHSASAMDTQFRIIGPALLLLPLSSGLFVLAYAALGLALIRAGGASRPAGGLVLLGALLFGPGPSVPLGVETLGGVLFGSGVVLGALQQFPKPRRSTLVPAVRPGVD